MLVKVFVAILLTGTADAFIANCSSKFSDLAYSINTVFCPAQCWTSNHTLCGNGPYRDGPVCLAAIHAGAISNAGGEVSAYVTGAFNSSTWTPSNGVNTTACGQQSVGYSFKMACDTMGKSEYPITSVNCPPNCPPGNVPATGSYALNTSVCGAAILNNSSFAKGGKVTLYQEFDGSSVVGPTCPTKQTAFTFKVKDHCSGANHCLNNGTCLSGVTTYVCDCAVGFNGTNCENNLNECLSNPCQNNATCKDLVNDYNCTCAFGYSGKNCTEFIGGCFASPCQNGANCSVDYTQTSATYTLTSTTPTPDLRSNYTCQPCVAGYNGKNCENDINDCLNVSCANGGTCKDLVNGYKCLCLIGTNGRNCENNTNDCDLSTCEYGAPCIDLINDYKCNCSSGYSGKNCSIRPAACQNKDCGTNGICLVENGEGKCKCYQGSFNIGSSCKVGCGVFSVNMKDSNDTLTFNITPANTDAASNQVCPKGRPKATAACRQINATAAEFKSPKTLSCNLNMSDVLASVDQVLKNLSTSAVSNALADLHLVTSHSVLEPNETKSVVASLSLLSQIDTTKANFTPNDVHNVLDIFDTVIASAQSSSANIPSSTSSIVYTQQKNVVLLINVIENFTDKVVIPPGVNPLQLSTSVTTVQVEQHFQFRPEGALTFWNQINEPQPKPNNQYETVRFNVSLLDTVSNSSQSGAGKGALFPVSATISGSILDQIASTLPSRLPLRVSVLMFNASSPDPQRYNQSTTLSLKIRGVSSSLLSYYISLIFYDMKGKAASIPQFPNRAKSLITETLCGWLDENSLAWTKQPCALVADSDPPECKCYSIGTFSMLFASKMLPSTYILEVFSTIGLSISVIALFITIVVYSYFKELRERFNSGFLINICVCLIFVNIIFMAGTARVQIDAPCYLSAVFLHYFLLAVWFWTSCYAYTMYRGLVKVMGVNSGKSIQASALLSYLAPLVIVGVVAGVTIFYVDEQTRRSGELFFFESSYRLRHACWLRLYSLYFSFLLPVGILAIFNAACLTIIMVSLTCKKVNIRSTAQGRTAKQDFFVAFNLFITFGLTWVFGFLMFFSEDVMYLEAMSWLFTIFNCVQGLVLFILNCVKQEKVRKMWLDPIIRAITCGKLMKEERRSSDGQMITRRDQSKTDNQTNSTGVPASAVA